MYNENVFGWRIAFHRLLKWYFTIAYEIVQCTHSLQICLIKVTLNFFSVFRMQI